MGGPARKIFKPKAKVQPKVASQMAAPKPITTPTGPTKAEMDDRRRLGINRRGRKATIITSVAGVDEDLTLGKKTLLS